LRSPRFWYHRARCAVVFRESSIRDFRRAVRRRRRYMRRMDTGTVVFIALIFVLAGFVKGVVGLGLATVGMGLLAIVMSPAQAASLLVVPSFITNVQQAVGARSLLLVARIWPTQPSCTFVRSPITTGSLSPRTIAENQMLASLPRTTLPMTWAVGASQTSSAID
jgi:hypothetical protein